METPIKSLSLEEIHRLLEREGLPSFRADQIVSWIYAKGSSSYGEMTNLPKALRTSLPERFPLNPSSVHAKRESQDGSRKYLVRFGDGVVTETVGLPSSDGRLTVCASSQAGCSMGCIFCATGKAGLTRNLLPGEIVDQVNIVQKDFNRRVTNVVVMGQGEPFANFDNTIAALRIMNHPKLLNIGARHVTVSTCGLLSGIRKFSDLTEQFTLAVSLHSARQPIRDRIMPSLRSQPLELLKQELASYEKKRGRRYTFEYALMNDVNDSPKDLQALIDFCTGMLCHVNLIPLNDMGDSSLKGSDRKTLSHWLDELEAHGIAASIRKSRGADIEAACGQLVASYSRGDAAGPAQ